MERNYPSVVLKARHIFLLVFLLTGSVFAASPSFNSFDTNDFTVVGSEIELNTNRFVAATNLLSAAGGTGGSTNAAINILTNYLDNEVSIQSPAFAGGARCDGIETTGTVVSNSTTLTAPSGTFALTDVGKTIFIRGGNTNNYDFTTTIAGFVSSSSVTLSAAPRANVTNDIIMFGTDDTAAVQAALNSVATNRFGGTVVFPAGITVLAGALQDVGDPNDHHNAQVYLPPINRNLQFGPVTIRLRGAIHPSGDYLGRTPMNSVIWSTLTKLPGSQTNYGRVFDFSDPAQSAAIGNVFNPIVYKARPQICRVVVEDLCLRMCFDTDMTGFDLYSVYQANLERVVVDGGYGSAGTQAPRAQTSTNQVGVVMPFEAAFNEHTVRDCRFYWLYNGLSFSGSDKIDAFTSYQCHNAFTCRDNPIQVTINHATIFESSNAFYLPYSGTYLDASGVDMYNGAFFTNNANLVNLSPSGFMSGKISYIWGSVADGNPANSNARTVGDVGRVQFTRISIDNTPVIHGAIFRVSTNAIFTGSVSAASTRIGSLYSGGPSYAAFGTTNGLFSLITGTAGDVYIMSGAAQPLHFFYNGVGGTMFAKIDSPGFQFPRGYLINSTTPANWPTAPAVAGDSYIGSSNGTLYVLYSTNGAGGVSSSWTRTNYFGP